MPYGRLLRPLDAATACDDVMEPQHLARQAALARPRQESSLIHARSALLGLPSACASRRVRFPSQRSPLISLPYRATFPLRFRTSSVIWNASPEQIAEAIEPVEIAVVAIGDKRADPHRVNEAVPGGLLQHEPQIVVRR